VNDRTKPALVPFSIAAVERDAGLTKDTLRIWERRYGFPKPGRDANGERVYPADQVEKLRIIKRLLDQGHRPGKIMGLSVDELQRLAGARARTAAPDAEVHPADDLERYVALVKSHNIEALRRELSQAVLRLGLARFVGDVVAPLNERVGDAWTRGDLEVFEEHLYTEAIQAVLHNAINTIPQSPDEDRRPRILLTTFPQEPHGLGILMAEAIFALEGARCISLGVQTPVWDILRAATTQQVDIVALSFTAALSPHQVLDGLAELRGKLPARVQIWAGGSCPILHRRPPKDVLTLRSLGEIGDVLAAWRTSHAA
jgi:DNA-binding transcriptional MerR regulator/methylmalonyl-CoA mutase cobalamin-binding subunit